MRLDNGYINPKSFVYFRVVGGLETLDKMEAVETNKHDKPREIITLEDAQVFVNPYDEVDEMVSLIMISSESPW